MSEGGNGHQTSQKISRRRRIVPSVAVALAGIAGVLLGMIAGGVLDSRRSDASVEGAGDAIAAVDEDGQDAEDAPEGGEAEAEDTEEDDEPPDRRLTAIGGELTPVPGVQGAVTALASRPGDPTAYALQRIGAIRLLRDGAVEPEPLLDFSEQVTHEGEGGALGLAFSPDGTYLYVSYTGEEGANVVDEYTVGGDGQVDLASQREVLRVEQPTEIHNAGDLAFGPDGMLYISVGDGHPEPSPRSPAQKLDSLLGKILRIDPLGGRPYAIPADNPFVEEPGASDEIWVYGLRNPWRFSFDAETGDLWIADVGHGLREEINVQRAGTPGGANYGWDLYEGSIPFSGYDGEPPADYVPPTYDYVRIGGERCAVIGGFVYRGTAFPALQGRYLYGDYCEGQLRMLELHDDGAYVDAPLGPVDPEPTVTAVVEGPDGEPYYLTMGGLFRLDPA